MEENKKKTPIWQIIILSLLGVCLVGFCVWYGINYFKGEDKSDESSNNINVDDANNLEKELNKIFTSSNDSNSFEISMIPSKEELFTSFDNITKYINNISIKYKCVKYSEYEFEHSNGNIETKNACTIVKATINNSVDFYHTVDYYLDSIINDLVLAGETIKKVISETDTSVAKVSVNSNKLIYYNNYLIDFSKGCCGNDVNDLIIYDMNGKKVLGYENVIKTVYKDLYNLEPKIVNSKLYFIKDNNHNCEYNYIDLSQNNLSVSFIKNLPDFDCTAYDK